MAEVEREKAESALTSITTDLANMTTKVEELEASLNERDTALKAEATRREDEVAAAIADTHAKLTLTHAAALEALSKDGEGAAAGAAEAAAEAARAEAAAEAEKVLVAERQLRDNLEKELAEARAAVERLEAKEVRQPIVTLAGGA